MKNQNGNQGNLITAFLYMFGVVAIVSAIIAFIAHTFDYKLRMYGADVTDVPALDGISASLIATLGIAMYGLAYFIEKNKKHN